MQRAAGLQSSLPAYRAFKAPTRLLVSLLDFAPHCNPIKGRQLLHTRALHSLDGGAAAASMQSPGPQLLSVAPMMDWTDVHYRQLARLISKHTWLYTEMNVDSTLIHNPSLDRFLWFPPEQHPIVCQLGGSNPAKLGAAAAIAARYGYDEINLNCGCPSDRVAGAGCFGASLMLQPELVGDACAAMRAAVGDTPITVKCRLGVDDVDSYQELCRFVRTVAERSDVRHFIIHARKCMLNGLSPHQNRTIPPLRWGWVWGLKRDFPELDFSLNGGLESCHQAAAALQHSPSSFAEEGAGDSTCSIHGVMIGRAAFHAPWTCLSDADVAVFGAAANAAASRREVLRRYGEYGDAVLGRFGEKEGGAVRYPSVRVVAKPLLGLFHNAPGGKRWRNVLDQTLLKKPATVSEAIEAAMKTLRDDVLDAPPHTCAALVAFAIGPLPQPQDRAGDGATSGGAARAKRKAGKRKCSDELLQSVQDCAGVTPCSSSSHAVGDVEKGCSAVGEPATQLRAPEGEGGRLRVACEAQEPNFAGDEDTGALREQVAAAGELCSHGRTLISV